MRAEFNKMKELAERCLDLRVSVNEEAAYINFITQIEPLLVLEMLTEVERLESLVSVMGDAISKPKMENPFDNEDGSDIDYLLPDAVYNLGLIDGYNQRREETLGSITYEI